MDCSGNFARASMALGLESSSGRLVVALSDRTACHHRSSIGPNWMGNTGRCCGLTFSRNGFSGVCRRPLFAFSVAKQRRACTIRDRSHHRYAAPSHASTTATKRLGGCQYEVWFSGSRLRRLSPRLQSCATASMPGGSVESASSSLSRGRRPELDW